MSRPKKVKTTLDGRQSIGPRNAPSRRLAARHDTAVKFCVPPRSNAVDVLVGVPDKVVNLALEHGNAGEAKWRSLGFLTEPDPSR